MAPLFRRFAAEMRARNWSEGTVDAYRVSLIRFEKYLAKHHRDVTSIDGITADVVSAYQLSLCATEKERGIPGTLAPATQHSLLVALKSFFAFLELERLVLVDPARHLAMPKLGRRLPRGILTPKEIRALLRQPDLSTYLGLRDRAILETLYSTGLRNTEARLLKVQDVDLERGFVTVIKGKGKKDRVVPLGKAAVHFVTEYLTKARPHMLRSEADETLFLSSYGGPLSSVGLHGVVKTHAKAAGIARAVFPHGIRHTCATGMLRGRADIRYIQEMLGHGSLSSTEIYTHVEIGDLKRVHRACHPREKELPSDPEWD